MRGSRVARGVQTGCSGRSGGDAEGRSEKVELGDVIDDILTPMADQVIAEATQLWNGAAGLRSILVAGGGALLLGEYVKRHFRHAVVVEDPVFANAVGFWKFARRVAG